MFPITTTLEVKLEDKEIKSFKATIKAITRSNGQTNFYATCNRHSTVTDMLSAVCRCCVQAYECGVKSGILPKLKGGTEEFVKKTMHGSYQSKIQLRFLLHCQKALLVDIPTTYDASNVMVCNETKPPPKYKNYISGGPRFTSNGETSSGGQSVLFAKTKKKKNKEGAKYASEESRLVSALNPSPKVMSALSQNSDNNYNPSIGLSIDESLSEKKHLFVQSVFNLGIQLLIVS